MKYIEKNVCAVRKVTVNFDTFWTCRNSHVTIESAEPKVTKV